MHRSRGIVGSILHTRAPHHSAISKGAKVIDAFARRVIASRRRTAGDGGELGPDLLSRFLDDAARKKEDEEAAAAAKASSAASSQQGGSRGAEAQGAEARGAEARLGGTDEELRDVVLNFIIAGRDTTACALSWTLYELAKAPAVVAKLRDEFNHAFRAELAADATAANATAADSRGGGGSRLEDAGTFEKVSQLSYAHAVSLEVLRLHPSVAKDIKWAVNDDVLPDGTPIRSGAAVIYCPYAMGRDPRYWDDPLAFRPERFLGEREPNMYEYPVFNAGPRLCMGKPLALMETKLVTAMLLHHFEFALAEPHAGGYVSTVVLPMSPGLMVRLTPRSHATIGEAYPMCAAGHENEEQRMEANDGHDTADSKRLGGASVSFASARSASALSSAGSGIGLGEISEVSLVRKTSAHRPFTIDERLSQEHKAAEHTRKKNKAA